MWQPRRPTTPRFSTACYRDSSTFLFFAWMYYPRSGIKIATVYKYMRLLQGKWKSPRKLTAWGKNVGVAPTYSSKCLCHPSSWKVCPSAQNNRFWTSNSAVGMSTGYGLDCREVAVPVPVGVKFFSQRRPDRICGPPSLLSNRYQGIFPWE
jgi:hypothetical protein